MDKTLDRRLNAYRDDLADGRLKDRIAAARYADGEPAHITVPVADLKRHPDRGGPTDSQLLLGEDLCIFDRSDGWCWVQAEADGYVGYVEEKVCAAGAAKPSHRIVAPRTFLYPAADLKHPPLAALSAGSRLAIVDEAETRGMLYYFVEGGGAVIARHCLTDGEAVTKDYVSIAEGFLETPYLWGGRSGFGIDCSGLVQLSLSLAGMTAPRDSDMQAAGLGEPIGMDADEPALRRGDFIFWSGHVGMMEDTSTLIHASGHTMSVTREPLDEAIARIESQYGAPSCYRRL